MVVWGVDNVILWINLYLVDYVVNGDLFVGKVYMFFEWFGFVYCKLIYSWVFVCV